MTDESGRDIEFPASELMHNSSNIYERSGENTERKMYSANRQRSNQAKNDKQLRAKHKFVGLNAPSQDISENVMDTIDVR